MFTKRYNQPKCVYSVCQSYGATRNHTCYCYKEPARNGNLGDAWGWFQFFNRHHWLVVSIVSWDDEIPNVNGKI